MKESKGLTILSFIVVGIFLLPIIAVLLYVILGVSLFMVLYILTRKKVGKIDSKEGKYFKIASTIILVLGAFLMVFIYNINFNIVPDWDFNNLNWSGYLWLQLLVFVGLIPMDIFLINKIRNEKK